MRRDEHRTPGNPVGDRAADQHEAQHRDHPRGEHDAELLDRLSRPATATELAAELGLSLGTVGRHLRILREAGLIVGLRDGHKVVYRLTVRGADLITYN
ncbi:winged helix-turn-helix domain-containing protein [Kribbella sp. NPDC059898]|uniref:helix-turn-helix domain-containing protein n=1 Tax=Kribbella sp. NPDC059898 TaxID=3346995 RepID=UPI00366146E8